MITRGVRRWLGSFLAFLFLASSLQAALPDKLEQLRQKAQEHEKKGQWTDACVAYDQILRADRTLADIKDRYQTCLRHVLQLRRHRDPSLKSILDLPLPKALDAYEEVLRRLQSRYVERDKISLEMLFQNGLQELRFALEDEAFQEEHLTGISTEKIRSFITELERWPAKALPNSKDAREQLRGVGIAGLEHLGLNPGVVVVEFACGACNALDEYTAYLTPAQFNYIQASIKGEYVGIGIEVSFVDRKLMVAAVVANGPAAEKGLRPGDRITRIDGEAVEGMAVEGVLGKLLGKAGTTIEMEFTPPGEAMSQTVKIARAAVLVPSVERSAMVQEGIGYIRILNFQESTVQELRDALLSLQTGGMKSLVLDLRGNPGGLFNSAVEVAEMFLPSGTIAFTESPIKKFKNAYKSQNPNAITMPLVVIVDGDTASAAEVLAGALKENGRATIVGTTTFGKGCIQCVLPLDTVPSGLKITVMKFFSPTNQPYSGRGVTPHVLVQADLMDGQRSAAWQQAKNLLMMMR